jgi:hypothetical protein
LGLPALEVGPGDEVIVPANTYIATALAVSEVGGDVVLVDCDAADLQHQSAAGRSGGDISNEGANAGPFHRAGSVVTGAIREFFAGRQD